MIKLPASAGWAWVRQGFAIFRRQPGEMMGLFIAYMLLLFLIGVIPVIGQVLPLMLVPALSLSFTQACLQLERGEHVHPRLLLTGLRSPARPRLLQLGALYVVAAALAIAVSALVDGGTFWKVMSGQAQFDPKTMNAGTMLLAMIVAAAVYSPAAMAFWYAAPLIHYQRMGLGKALFYSFFAVWRAFAAFTVYTLGWLFVGVIAPTMVSVMLIGITGAPGFAVLVLLSVSLILTAIAFCSFYPTYTSVFGTPEEPDAPPAS
ncbi:MAG TPA: BPSS1780 family membrane protein [Burkholderiaceae bacterium]